MSEERGLEEGVVADNAPVLDVLLDLLCVVKVGEGGDVVHVVWDS